MSKDSIRTTVAAIWARSRDTVLGRVATLERAAQAADRGELALDARREAEREAHKLAGAVGTFGFWRASQFARNAEQLLQGDAPLAADDIRLLSSLAAELRAQLEADPDGAVGMQSGTPEAVTGDRATLLIVADDADLWDRVAFEARGLGVDVLGARDADAARALLAGQVDAIVLDLSAKGAGMAFLDELHVARPSVPVVVIANDEQIEDRIHAARLGGRGFLQRPVRASQLIDLLRDTLLAAREESPTIVAVDDDGELLSLIATVLQPLRARVVPVTDPMRALNALVEHAPDLIILDVDMPGVDGIELCRVLRNDPRWTAVPVLFLTAQQEPEIVQCLFEAGADDFVAKPVLGPELMARVRNRLERTRMLRLAADVDSLTGVSTRRRGIEVLERIFRLAQRQGQPISIAVIDLDHFKRVNDEFGHLAGDMVLRRVAMILSSCFRGEDIVARWGGEEFLVGMYGMPSAAAARRLEQGLATLRAESFDTRGSKLRVTFSAGVAEFPRDGGDWTTLYRMADDALSRAKTEGRNRVVAVE